MSASEPVYALPAGEVIVWQGRPEWRALARHAFKLPWVTGYFALVGAVSCALSANAHGLSRAIGDAALTGALGLACLGLLCLMAFLQARATLYTITTRRVIFGIGVALPMTWNLPFKQLAAATLKSRPEGDGDITLELKAPDRIAWLQLWPHVAPWHLLRARPSLRAIPEPARVATLLGDAVRDWSSGAVVVQRVTAVDAASSEHEHAPSVPRGMLIAVAALLFLTVAFAATARIAQLTAAPVAAVPAREVRILRFQDRPDGTLEVLDAETGREVSALAPGSNNFIRGVLRGMFRGRKLESLGHDGEFRLAREADGHLTLQDRQVGRRIDLESFGPTNRAAFADLLTAGGGGSLLSAATATQGGTDDCARP